jgi:hypothetical protein
MRSVAGESAHFLPQSYGELFVTTRLKGYSMALGLVLVGIAAGLLAAGCVLVLGGGLWLAVLAYTGGGVAGLIGGLARAHLPGFIGSDLASQEQR